MYSVPYMIVYLTFIYDSIDSKESKCNIFFN